MSAHGRQVKDVQAVGAVETGHLVPAPPEEARNQDTDVTPIPGDQNAHPAIIPADRQAGETGQLPPAALPLLPRCSARA